MILQPQLVMICWIPIVYCLFSRFKAQDAVIISFIFAWLFLPQQAGFTLPGLPDYERMSATVYGILLCTILLDFQRFRTFSFNRFDLPMLIWCICPLFSSISNDLGVYDGLSAALSQTVAYGGPYFLGRIYLTNIAGMHRLATSIFVGGLLYVPFCLYEVRFSPQLHRIVYGYHSQSFAQSIRYGGFRPVVFMQHGLAVGTWMMAATLIGIWLWRTGVIRQIYGVHIGWLVGILTLTVILNKSTGAYGLLLLGIIILFFAWQFNSSIPLFLLIISMFFYLQQSVSLNSRLPERILTTLDSVVPPERLQSLEFRFKNEEVLIDKAQQRRILGWGGWNRNRVYDYDWQGNLVDNTTVDSLWIIAFGRNGLVGLISWFGSVLIPVTGIILLYLPGGSWSTQKLAPVAAIAVILTLYSLDGLLNNMPNPIFNLAAGGITGLMSDKNS